MPSYFGIGFLIDCPIQRSSLDGVELHKHFWNISKSVEEKLAWLFADMSDPTKIFQKEVGGI
jgi:hypothetical protein